MVSLATPVYISVRAVTNNFGKDISRSLSGYRRNISRDGENLGRAFTQGFNRGVDTNAFRRVANGIRSMIPEADGARRAFQSLVRTGYTLGTAMTVLVGGISSVIGGLFSLIGAAGGAASTIAVLGNGFIALGLGAIAAKLALGGVGAALKKYNTQVKSTATASTQTAIQTVRDAQAREAAARRIEDAERTLARLIESNRQKLMAANISIRDAQLDLNRAIREGKEELQQLGFEAEDAALGEKRAAVELERARETLARVQDLPPNSRARQEAELAFQEAELNYRKAKDLSSDLNAEQDRLAKSGVNGLDSVIAARKRLSEAEADKAQTIKDALQSEEDALRDLEQARKDAANVDDRQNAAQPAATAPGGGEVPGWADGLNKWQRDFVLFLASLKPKLDELKAIAAEAFLPRLQQAIQILVDELYPTIARGIGIVATAMGDAAINLAKIITTAANVAKLNTLFESSGRIILSLGNIFGHLYDILLSIFVATAPMAERFFTFIEEKMGAFAAHLNSDEGRNELISFFEKAEYTAKLFGDVLGNVFGGIGAVIMANIGPGTGGDILLTWLKDATAGLGSDGEALKQYFIDVANNATSVLDALGALGGALSSVGANQSIGDTFDVLIQGAPALTDILNKTADAGPDLAQLVVTITEIIDALTDTSAIQIFFDVLNSVASLVRDFVSDPAVKEFLDFFGRIFAALSAVGLIMGGVGFAIKVLAGSILAIISPLATVVGLFNAKNIAMIKDKIETGILMGMYAKDAIVRGAQATAMGLQTAGQWALSAAQTTGKAIMTGLSAAWRVFNGVIAANPIGLLVTAIAAVVAGLIYFFTQTEEGKKMWAEFTRFLGEAWENISKFFIESWTNISKFFSDTWTNISKFFTDTWNNITRFFSDTWKNITKTLTDVIRNITRFFTDSWNNISSFIDGIWKTITGIFDFALKLLVDWFLNWTIYGIIINNWEAISKFFSDVWKNIMGFFDAAFKWIDKYVIQPFNLAMWALGKAFEAVGKFIGDVWRNIQNAINVVWQWIDKNIFKPIRDGIAFVQRAFELAKLGIDITWKKMRDNLNTVWEWIEDHVFNPIKTAVGLIQKAFENTVTGIGKAWEGIKRAAAIPINFVIDTVYNNGLRSFWNDIANNLNMKHLTLPRANTVKFASGGVMPGYSPGKDIHKFYSPTGGYLHLSGGEAIMRPEWTRMVGGPAAVERMNRAARKGQKFASGGVFNGGGSSIPVRRYKDGGVVDFAGDVVDNIGKVFAVVGDFFANPLAAVQKHLIDGIIKPLLNTTGGSLFEQLVGGVPVSIANGIAEAVSSFFQSNPQPGKGSTGMGWQAQWDVVKQAFPWARLHGGYRDPGRNARVGGAKGSYHTRGRAIDVNPSMEIFNWLAGTFPNSRELIYSPANGRQLLNGQQHMWGGNVRKMHYNHVHWAMAKGGTVFPSKDGSIVRVAEAGKPERVEPLDPNGLSDRDKAMIEYLSGGAGGGITINVYQLPGEDVQALAERISRLLSFDMRRGGIR